MSRLIHYLESGIRFEGYLALPEAQHPISRKPSILIAPTWAGRNEEAMYIADDWASRGYPSMVIDLYGDGKCGSGRDECAELMGAVIQDRNLLFRRIHAALNALKDQPEVDPDRIAALGFCFGGLCVLDLARGNAKLKGVASIHGLFSPPEVPTPGPIGTKILVLHGFDDPMATPDEGTRLGKELTERGADFQIHYFGSTQHAFTNPNANDPGFGTVFHPTSTARTQRLLLDFLNEVLQ